jgi:hypothetical protein
MRHTSGVRYVVSLTAVDTYHPGELKRLHKGKIAKRQRKFWYDDPSVFDRHWRGLGYRPGWPICRSSTTTFTWTVSFLVGCVAENRYTNAMLAARPRYTAHFGSVGVERHLTSQPTHDPDNFDIIHE